MFLFNSTSADGKLWWASLQAKVRILEGTLTFQSKLQFFSSSSVLDDEGVSI
jgi:hypothetical protein